MPLDIDDDRMPGLVSACITSWKLRYPEISFDSIPNTKNMKKSIEYLFRQFGKCIDTFNKNIYELSSKYQSTIDYVVKDKILDDLSIKFRDTDYEYQIVYYATGSMHYCYDKIYMNTNQNNDCIYVNCNDIICEILAKNKNYSYFSLPK